MQEKTETGRKLDRRTLYTRNAVKDALLELLEEQSYEKITVASLCRQAEITRATFYLHYQSLDEVLDELMDEALMTAEAAAHEMSTEERMEKLKKVVQAGDVQTIRENEWLLSPCQRVADDPKYRAIFEDATLSSYVIRRVYKLERDSAVPYLMKECRLSHDEADKLFMMLIYGLYYMNRSLKWNKDDSWYEMQLLIDRFMFGGNEALRNRFDSKNDRA